jgi:hypothetical protein
MAVRTVRGILLSRALRRNCRLPARRAHQRRSGSACPVPEYPGWVSGKEPAPGRRLPSCPNANVSRSPTLQSQRDRGRVPLPVLGEREHVFLSSVCQDAIALMTRGPWPYAGEGVSQVWLTGEIARSFGGSSHSASTPVTHPPRTSLFPFSPRCGT